MIRFKRHLIVLAAILFVAVLPLIPVVVASVIASANGCRLDEGSKHSCVILGFDVGGLLYTMGVLGWLAIATIPGAALLMVPWFVWVLITLVRSKR